MLTLERPPVRPNNPSADPHDIRGNAKVILDVGGVLIPSPGGTPDPELDWVSGAMFDGDHFFYSMDHAKFISDLYDLGAEVYILSGLGANAASIFSTMYNLELDWIKTFSEKELEIGDTVIARKDFSVNGVAAETSVPVVWVDDRATLQSQANLLVVKPKPTSGLTKTQMIKILDFITERS